MKFQTILLSLILIPMLAACGGTSRWEGVCKANVEEQLLNPETLQMLDFKPVTIESYASINADYMVEKVAADSAEYIPEERKNILRKQAAENVAANLTAYFDSDEIKLFSARVRAEGPLGNTVTKTASCAVFPQSNECSCDF